MRQRTSQGCTLHAEYICVYRFCSGRIGYGDARGGAYAGGHLNVSMWAPERGTAVHGATTRLFNRQLLSSEVSYYFTRYTGLTAP